ncbi:MAG: DNA-binding domain-containing protein, partial [Chthoniobacteraceae bacterium]
MAARSPLKSAPSLREIQRAIAGTLMRPLAPGERMRRDATEVANRFIKPNDRLTSFERLQIYNQQYWWRLMGSFQEDYRGLMAVLGERKFERLAVAYLEQRGSTSWNLRDLGDTLGAFVREHPGLVAPHEALSAEMIRVEWARVLAFDGPEKPPLDPAKLGAAPERLRISLQPYITLLELQYPIDEMLGRLRKRNTETGSVSNAVSATTS